MSFVFQRIHNTIRAQSRNEEQRHSTRQRRSFALLSSLSFPTRKLDTMTGAHARRRASSSPRARLVQLSSSSP